VTTTEFDQHYHDDAHGFYAVKSDYELNSRYLVGLQSIAELYQDPIKADKIYKAKQDLEDTKIILGKTLEDLLGRVRIDCSNGGGGGIGRETRRSRRKIQHVNNRLEKILCKSQRSQSMLSYFINIRARALEYSSFIYSQF